VGLEDVIINHGDILPAGYVARLDLFDVAKLAEDLVGLVLQGEELHAVVVERCVAQFGVHAGFYDGKYFFCQAVAGIFAAGHIAAPVQSSGSRLRMNIFG